jgi:hypothetical protein
VGSYVRFEKTPFVERRVTWQGQRHRGHIATVAWRGFYIHQREAGPASPRSQTEITLGIPGYLFLLALFAGHFWPSIFGYPRSGMVASAALNAHDATIRRRASNGWFGMLNPHVETP